ncbi:hypothetical protein AAY473_013505, partial [Plecturocebus cupreus]
MQNENTGQLIQNMSRGKQQSFESGTGSCADAQRQCLTLLPRVECSGAIIARCSLQLGSSDPSTSASSVAGTTETESCYVAQAGLKLLDSRDPSTSASQSARIIGVNYLTQSGRIFKHFGRPRQVDHLRSGVQDQPGQHGETPSLSKRQKLA